MITRREAETQAEQCLKYHAAMAAGLVGLTAILDRRSVAWIAAACGTGVALHSICLFGVPAARESILRSTASLMEDLRNSAREQDRQREAVTAAR